MNEFELVIVGGGLTSARAIKHYRLAGGDGRVALLTREHSLPYHRPPLSKRYLRGEIEQEDTLVEPKSFYDENDVELVLATDASEVRPRDRAVVTGSGERYRYARRHRRRRAVPDEPPDVYAAGDVACFIDPLYERRRRIEHWSNANYQGAEVGKVLAGADGGYDTVSTFFTESFGMTLKVFGDLSRHDDRILRGSFEEGNAIAFYFDQGRLVGTLLTGQDEMTEETLKRLIYDAALEVPSEILEQASAG